jgi:hypothetical protein
VSLDEALDIALQNLREKTPEAQFEMGDCGVYRATYGDNYDPSRLLLPELIAQIDLHGDPVAVVPNRETLLVTGVENEAGLVRMGEMAMDAMKLPRPRSGIPLRFRNGRWETFEVPNEHPAAAIFTSLKNTTLASAYGAQERTLERKNAEAGDDVRVAEYFMSAAADSEYVVRSMSILSKGIPTMLPETDLITLSNSNAREVTVAPWLKVQHALGERMRPMGLYPERYYVDGFPSDEDLEGIGIEGWTRRPMDNDDVPGPDIGPESREATS